MNTTDRSVQTIIWILALTGLFTEELSRAYSSISLIGLLVTNIYFGIKHPVQYDSYKRNAILILSCALMASHLPSFLMGNTLEVWQRLVVKLPLIFLPLSMLRTPALLTKQYVSILSFFTLIVVCIATGMFINYLLHFEEFNVLYAESSVMPGPINHIRLSLIFAFTAYVMYRICFVEQVLQHRKLKVAAMCALIWLVLFIHVYSVRGGLLALYTLTVYEMAIRIIKSKSRWKLIGVAMGSILLLVIIGSLMPTIRNKTKITFSELKNYDAGNSINHSSLGKRFASYSIATDLFRESPIFGCGIGNYPTLNAQMFRIRYSEVEVPILAHNQFLLMLAMTGIYGFILFIISLFYPFLHKKHFSTVFTAHLLVLFVSFQTEPMLETQLGVLYTVLFWGLTLHTNDSLSSVSEHS